MLEELLKQTKPKQSEAEIRAQKKWHDTHKDYNQKYYLEHKGKFAKQKYKKRVKK